MTIVRAAQNKDNDKQIIRRNITELIKKEIVSSNITYGAELALNEDDHYD